MSARKAFQLRISAGLFEDLRRWADADFRSVNGQMEFLLQKAVNERKKATAGKGPKPDPAVDET